MGADDDIYFSIAEIFNDSFLLSLRAEAIDALNGYRKTLHSFSECFRMLFSKNSGGN